MSILPLFFSLFILKKKKTSYFYHKLGWMRVCVFFSSASRLPVLALSLISLFFSSRCVLSPSLHSLCFFLLFFFKKKKTQAIFIISLCWMWGLLFFSSSSSRFACGLSHSLVFFLLSCVLSEMTFICVCVCVKRFLTQWH